MKLTNMFVGAADRERALRYSGNLGEDEGESDQDEDEAPGRFPISGSGRKAARGGDDDDGDPSEDEERAWLEEVYR